MARFSMRNQAKQTIHTPTIYISSLIVQHFHVDEQQSVHTNDRFSRTSRATLSGNCSPFIGNTLGGVIVANGMVTAEKRLHSKSLSRRKEEEEGRNKESHEQPNNIIVQSMKNPRLRMAKK